MSNDNDGKNVGEKINRSCNTSFENGIDYGRMGCYNERIGNIIKTWIVNNCNTNNKKKTKIIANIYNFYKTIFIL